MFCPKCGKQLKDGTKFCGECGAEINDNISSSALQNITSSIMTDLSAIKPKKVNKKVIFSVAAVGVIAISAIIGTNLYNQPQARMNRAISAGNISEAYNIYSNELYGTALSEKIIDKLKGRMDDILESYKNDNITYEAATSSIYELKEFSYYTTNLSSYIYEKEEELYSLHNYRNYLSKADECYNNNQYLNALKYYQKALALNAESTEATSGISKTKDAYKNDIISQVDRYLASRDYRSAENALLSALNELPDDSALTEKLNGLGDLQIQNIVDDAYSAANCGDWDGAVEILEEAQSNYSSNQKINTAYKDIKERMPITLKNITTISSDRINVTKDVVKDRYGNIYDGGVSYDAYYGEPYGLYNLSGKYTTFTTTAFPSTDTDNKLILSISIYLDDELVYYKDEITNETAPIDISLDVTGKQTMRIIVKSSDTWGRAYLYFSNSSFKKANA